MIVIAIAFQHVYVFQKVVAGNVVGAEVTSERLSWSPLQCLSDEA